MNFRNNADVLSVNPSAAGRQLSQLGGKFPQLFRCLSAKPAEITKQTPRSISSNIERRGVGFDLNYSKILQFIYKRTSD